MKYIYLLVLLVPNSVLASHVLSASHSHGIPEDFKRYFYRSEIIAQIYVNDSLLFDGALSLHENGDIRLIRIIEEDSNVASALKNRWADILRQGVTVGECSQQCPSGLMSVDYRLDNSVLKLYTSQYETQHVAGMYLDLPNGSPNGVIMYNDVSAVSTSSAQSWNLNSSLISSIEGWTQKAAFQSYGVSGHYNASNTNIHELYTQKELAGDFIRFGLFSPDSDAGNVQVNGFDLGSVAGVMWGTSDALLIENEGVSAWPVYVTGGNQSIAEVWRDGRLIYTQQLQSGVQALDTRRLPDGIYDVTVNIIENGKIINVQSSQIYKPQGWNNPDEKWRMNLWAGQKRLLAFGGDEDNAMPFVWGSGIDYLLFPRVVLGVSSAVTAKEHQVRARTNMTLSPNDSLLVEHAITDNQFQKYESTDVRYYRNLSLGSSMNLFWRGTTSDIYNRAPSSRQYGEIWGASLSTQLPWSASFIFNGQYIDTEWRKGVGLDTALTAKVRLLNRDMNFRLSAYDRPGFNQNNRDHGVTFGLSISLSPQAEHTISADVGINDRNSYSSLNYQWQPRENGNVRWLGGGVSHSTNSTTLNGNGALEGRYLNGDFYVQHNTFDRDNTAGVNLSQALILGGGRIATGNGYQGQGMESAFIVDVESDDPEINIMATDNLTETSLLTGRNIVPTSVWKKDTVQFSAAGNSSVKIFPEHQYVQMNRGSVQHVKLKAVKTRVLVGILQDENGVVLKNRQINSDVATSIINPEGVLTVESGIHNHALTVLADEHHPTLYCHIPDNSSVEQPVQFYNIIHCQPGEVK